MDLLGILVGTVLLGTLVVLATDSVVGLIIVLALGCCATLFVGLCR